MFLLAQDDDDGAMMMMMMMMLMFMITRQITMMVMLETTMTIDGCGLYMLARAKGDRAQLRSDRAALMQKERHTTL